MNKCDIRTCDETDRMKLTIVCDGLSGKKQMVLCYECYDAFFGTHKFNEPTDAELTETLTDKELNKELNIKECCACNDCDSESLTDCEHEVESCCECEGHEWTALDNGETHECRHCDVDISLDEIEADYGGWCHCQTTTCNCS